MQGGIGVFASGTGGRTEGAADTERISLYSGWKTDSVGCV